METYRPHRIPQELKTLKRWLCWREEQRDGKPTKVPYTPRGEPASSTDPSTWTDHETALAAAKDFDGVGIVLGDNLCGVDLDECRNPQTGEIHSEAQKIISGLNSYTEVSPSKTGLKVFCYGVLPPGRRRIAKPEWGPDGELEMYSSARYFTVTGERLDGCPATVEERTEALADLHRRTFPQPQAPAPAPVSPGPSLSDQELLRRMFAAKNGAQAQKLWSGDWSGYASWSEGDCALCRHLAFWWAGDRAAIDRMFRQSGLMREKWERADYRDSTIDKALEGMAEFYTPAPPPAEEEPPEEIHLTDTGNSLRLVAQHGVKIRYCWSWRKWLAWTGRHWSPDGEDVVMRLASKTVRRMYGEAAKIKDKEERKALWKHATSSESAHRRRAMMYLAQAEEEVACRHEIFDRDPWLLNCWNGTLDLRTGELRGFRQDDYITKVIGTSFDQDASCPRWLAFLDGVFDGNRDMVQFIQRAAGYCMTGDVREDALFFLYGTGANGKTTLFSTLQKVLGPYAIEVSPGLLLTRHYESHPTIIMDLFGVRFAVSVEVGQGRRFDEERLKQLTGGDMIRGRRMREDTWQFDATHKIWLAANEKPQVTGQDHAIWRRIKLIPFQVKFTPPGEPGPDIDTSLRENLFADERPGILTWMLEGCLSWQTDGLAYPAEVNAATAEYKAEEDVVQQFIDSECAVGPDLHDGAGDLHKAYQKWARDTRNRSLTATALGKRFAEKGFPGGHDGKRRIRRKLCLHISESEKFTF